MFSTSVKILLLGCIVFTLAVAQQDNSQMLGAVRILRADDLKRAEKTLQNSLRRLAAGDGPHYRIFKVHSATLQIVSGTLTKMHAELIDNKDKVKNCDVAIWSRPWLPNGIQVTFECEGEAKLVREHSI